MGREGLNLSARFVIIGNESEAIAMNEEKRYLECEKRWVFAMLIFVAGLYGGYTLSVRGGVFCNGQTGNIALLGVALGGGNWRKAIYYLIPISAYLLGIMVSEIIPRHVRYFRLRWDTLLTLIEIVVVIVMGFIPASAPHQICQVRINFICAMQYNTFRQAEGMSMATTFCVNHLRVVGTALSRLLLRRYDPAVSVEQMKNHGVMLVSFVSGAIAAGLLCYFFGVRGIWFALIPLIILATDLLRADLVTEKELLHIPPSGHEG
jgi:uncharacterized membrane protein YoaK (UPF0700 family)